jgi:hypothetical protein
VNLTAVSLSAIAADRLAGNKQSQPAPSSPALSSPAPDAIDATVLAFETSQYSVRIFRQSGDLRMNLYNRQADKAEQNNLPMLVHVADTGITFTNRGDRSTVYSVGVAPDGSNYRLTIQQGDRVIYNQQVAHAPAATPSPVARPEPSLAPSPNAQIPLAPPPVPTPASSASPAASPSTSSRDLAPRQLAPDPSAAPADATIPDSATIALFQTAKYAVRIYDDSGELRMNLYNRRTDKVELKAAPVQAARVGQTATAYTNLAGNSAGSLVYTAIVEPVGGYRLQVRQGDRVIYSELGY